MSRHRPVLGWESLLAVMVLSLTVPNAHGGVQEVASSRTADLAEWPEPETAGRPAPPSGKAPHAPSVGAGAPTRAMERAARGARPSADSTPGRLAEEGRAAPRPGSRIRSVLRPEDREDTDPGGVATTVVRIPAPEGARIAYEILVVPGVRLLGPASGSTTAGPDGAMVPVTVALPSTAAAGAYRAGEVRVTLPGGETRRIPLETRVALRRQLVLELGAEAVQATVGRVAEIPFRVSNGGNATDTLRLQVRVPAGWGLVGALPGGPIGAGESVTGVLRLAAPERAGSSAGIAAVVASGSGTRITRPVRVTALEPAPTVSGLVDVPASVFVGSTTGDASAPSLAFRADGEVAPGTRLAAAVRSAPEGLYPTAFREAMLGPHVHVALTSERWSLEGGDLYGRPDLLTGSVLGTRGVSGSWLSGGTRVQLTAGRPGQSGHVSQDGSMLGARAAATTDAGEFGLKLSRVEHAPLFASRYSLLGLGGTYDLEANGHRVRVEAGFLEVADTLGSRSGAVLDARYDYAAAPASLGLRLRRVPATVRTTSSYGNEALLTGGLNAAPGLTLNGWGYARSAPLLHGAETRSSGGGLGVVALLPGDARVHVTATYRAAERAAGSTSVSRTAGATLHVPVGGVMAELETDVGSVSEVLTRVTHRTRAGVRWSAGRSWAWAGASYHDPGYGRGYTTLDATGQARVGSVEVFGGVTARLDGGPFARAVTVWSGSSIPLARATDLAVGLDYQPTGAQPRPRVSVGLSHRLRLPLPVPRGPALKGVVFEDRNGNRVLDEDESPVAGAVVEYGPFRTTTDRAGRFAFTHAAGDTPRMDPAALPADLLLPPDVHLPASGEIAVPLVRLGSIRAHLLLDRDGDGRLDPAESAAARMRVRLRDDRGRALEAMTDADGSVRFGALEAGSYTLSVEGTTAGRAERVIELAPGSSETLEIAVPARRREIRSGGGQALLLMRDSPDR